MSRVPIEALPRLLELAHAAGAVRDSTPALVIHDLDLLDRRLAELAAAFPTGTET